MRDGVSLVRRVLGTGGTDGRCGSAHSQVSEAAGKIALL